MARWAEVEAEAGPFVARVRPRLDLQKHKTIATLRADGAPRISGIEIMFVDGDLLFGGSYRSRKCLDLQRDPRFALHGPSVDPPEDPTTWEGDAKLAGRAVEITDQDQIARIMGTLGSADPPGPMHLFRADVTEVVLTKVGDPADHLVVESWHEGRGMSRAEVR
jgi:hypothetical protein